MTKLQCQLKEQEKKIEKRIKLFDTVIEIIETLTKTKARSIFMLH